MNAESPPVSIANQPDWSSQAEKVPCPLCDYDLRGLIDPRCPECGYQFEWPDLLDPARRLHPFLFEHHPRRNYWSFLKTSAAASRRPTKFWSSLLPSQPSVLRRLIGYWLVHSILMLILFAAMFSKRVYDIYNVTLVQRAALRSSIQRYPVEYQLEIQQAGSIQEFIDQQWPLPPHWEFFQRAIKWDDQPYELLLSWIAVLIAWPWLSAAALMLYRASMRQSQIRPSHVLRCTIYSNGVSVLIIGVLVYLALDALSFRLPAIEDLLTWRRVGRIALLTMGLLLVYRLSRAYRHYLQFRQATIAVSLSQIVVVLVVVLLVYAAFDFAQVDLMFFVSR